MPYIAPEVITEAKRMDLLTYLREYEPGELVKFSSNTYTTRTHDSLKISNGKWMWWSRGIGGKSALDYLIKVRGMDFVEAVQTIMGNGSVSFPTCENIKSYENQPLLLPEKSPTTDVVFDYLFGRGIDYEIINYCLEQKLIIESLPYHNAVFIGYDENKEPKYAAYRATNQSRIMGDCTGSKKQYSFRLTAENTGEVHLFECAIDLLSYATLMKLEGKDWRQFNLVSLAGVYSPKQKIEDSKVPVTLGRLLEKDKTIRRIVLHLDNDIAGRKATKALQTILSDRRCGSSSSSPGWHSVPGYSGCTRLRRSTAPAERRMLRRSVGCKEYSPCPSAFRPTRHPDSQFLSHHLVALGVQNRLHGGRCGRWPMGCPCLQRTLSPCSAPLGCPRR